MSHHRRRLVREAHQDALGHLRQGPSRATTIRRRAAQLLAAVSRGCAGVVRRLDARVADDLGRTLAPAE